MNNQEIKKNIEVKKFNKSKFVDWNNDSGFPYFRAFMDTEGIPFIDNKKENGRILLGCIFEDSAPKGWKIVIKEGRIYLEKVKE